MTITTHLILVCSVSLMARFWLVLIPSIAVMIMLTIMGVVIMTMSSGYRRKNVAGHTHILMRRIVPYQNCHCDYACQYHCATSSTPQPPPPPPQRRRRRTTTTTTTTTPAAPAAVAAAAAAGAAAGAAAAAAGAAAAAATRTRATYYHHYREQHDEYHDHDQPQRRKLIPQP